MVDFHDLIKPYRIGGFGFCIPESSVLASLCLVQFLYIYVCIFKRERERERVHVYANCKRWKTMEKLIYTIHINSKLSCIWIYIFSYINFTLKHDIYFVPKGNCGSNLSARLFDSGRIGDEVASHALQHGTKAIHLDARLGNCTFFNCEKPNITC